jgi:ribosome modulation factor
MYGYAYIQWKIVLARMHDANMAATEITQQGQLTSPAARQIAEYHLNRYFEMASADAAAPARRRAIISAYERGRAAAQHGKHTQACPFDTSTNEWRSWRNGFYDALSSSNDPTRQLALRRFHRLCRWLCRRH